MSDVWETKDGLRRVRRDPPTLDDAVLAAQGLTEDLEGQIEIVVALMSVPADEARRAVLKTRRPEARTKARANTLTALMLHETKGRILHRQGRGQFRSAV